MHVASYPGRVFLMADLSTRLPVHVASYPGRVFLMADLSTRLPVHVNNVHSHGHTLISKRGKGEAKV